MVNTEGNKPKILIVIGVLWIGGGAERVVATLGNELTKRGYETHILTFYEHPEKYEYNGIYHSLNEVPKKNRFAKILRIPQRIWKIYKYVRTHNIDITISFLEEANFYTLLAKFINWRMPTIVSVRNNLRQREWPFRLASRVLYPFADKVVCVTRGIEQMIKEDFGLKNTTTIYNPINKNIIENKAQETLPKQFMWMKNYSPLFVHIGRHTKQKGHWHLLRAFQNVIKNIPQARLIMLGDGEDRKKLESFVSETDLEKNVCIIGNQKNVFPFLSVADCAVYSSLWEGMPNSVLESLAVGVPIVSTDCQTGPREILSPELKVDESISYPYRTPYGILTRPLSSVERYESIKSVPLDNAEQELADAMIESLNTDYDQEVRKQRVSMFLLEEIISIWEELLKEHTIS